jgi:hypothetical protein
MVPQNFLSPEQRLSKLFSKLIYTVLDFTSSQTKQMSTAVCLILYYLQNSLRDGAPSSLFVIFMASENVFLSNTP